MTAMATDRRPDRDDDQEAVSPPRGRASIQDRIAAFVMLDSMKDATQAQKSLRLWQVGFTNSEIAAILQTSTAVVSQNLYNERKKGAKKQTTHKGAKADNNGG
jgi:hypothetical protein